MQIIIIYIYRNNTVYFPVSKYHLTNIYMKVNSNTDCVLNVKSVEVINELGQSQRLGQKLGQRFIQCLLKINSLNLSQEDLKELVAK